MEEHSDHPTRTPSASIPSSASVMLLDHACSCSLSYDQGITNMVQRLKSSFHFLDGKSYRTICALPSSGSCNYYSPFRACQIPTVDSTRRAVGPWNFNSEVSVRRNKAFSRRSFRTDLSFSIRDVHVRTLKIMLAIAIGIVSR